MQIQSVLLIVLFVFATAIAVVTTSPQPVVAQKSVDVPVTTTIADSVNNMAMQIQSDGLGPYVNTRYVQSIVQGAFPDWELDTDYSRFSNRSVWLDFTKPVPGSGPNETQPVAPFSSGLVKARFISKCHLYNVNMFTIAAGSTVNCPLIMRFTYAGDVYRLHMNPIAGSDYYPETDYLDITCNAVNSSSTCVSWQIEPNGTKGGCVSADCLVKQNIARLNKTVTVKGKTTEANQGDFYVAFSISLRDP